MCSIQEEEDREYEFNARYDYIREAYGNQIDNEYEYQCDQEMSAEFEAAFIGPPENPTRFWDFPF